MGDTLVVYGMHTFVDESVGVGECVYQCRGGASVFRTGHCVCFVVYLQGGSLEGM